MLDRSQLQVHSTETRILIPPDHALERGAQALREIFPEFPRLEYGKDGTGISANLFQALILRPPSGDGCLLVWDGWQLALQQHGVDPVLLYETPMLSRCYWNLPKATQRRAAFTYWVRAHLNGQTHAVGSPNLGVNDLASSGGLSGDLVYPQEPDRPTVAVYKGRRDGGAVLVNVVGGVNRAFFMPG